MTCFTLCEDCGVPIPDGESAHFRHEIGCGWFLAEMCRCDGWVCMSCCPDPDCAPGSLAARLREAREDTLARAAVAEAAYGEAV